MTIWVLPREVSSPSIADNQKGERKKKRWKGDGLYLLQKKPPDFHKTGVSRNKMIIPDWLSKLRPACNFTTIRDPEPLLQKLAEIQACARVKIIRQP
jgi:hypothetical protein